MPDLQTEMQKILQAWDKPEVTETTQPTEQPKGKRMFAPSNNVSQDTFNFIRDNAGLPRHDVIRLLVQQGHKKSSVSSLIGQMLRQGLIWHGGDGALYPNAKEYAPIKSARTLGNQAKKSSKLRTSKVKSEVSPDYLTEAKRAIIGKPVRSKIETILDDISLSDAHELYRKLHQYFGGLPK